MLAMRPGNDIELARGEFIGQGLANSRIGSRYQGPRTVFVLKISHV